MARRFHKYGKRQADGFRSGFESQVARNLAGKTNWSYEGRSFDLLIPRSYTPDFFLDNGVVLEVKGYFDAEDRRLIKLFKEQHSSVDIRMVLQKPHQKLTKTGTMTYAAWCDKYHVPWCEGPSVPSSWLL
jgi:Phage endonuclease I